MKVHNKTCICTSNMFTNVNSAQSKFHYTNMEQVLLNFLNGSN